MPAEYSGMKLQTEELVELIIKMRGRVIEAALTNGFFNFTHFMDYGGRVIYDMGIDSREVSWKPYEFLKFYQNAWWQIDQIV
jgi:hypothetical protein